MHHGVPEQVAEHRGDDPEEQQIAPHRRACEHLPFHRERVEGKDRKNGQQSVEKDFPGDEDCGVAASDAFDDQRVDHPQQCRRECQHVAPRRELQHEMPVEHHEDHAGESQRRPCDLPPRHPFAAVCEAHRHGRPYGRRADDQRDVRGRGVLQGDILGQEVERPAAQSGRREQQFVAQIRGQQPPAGEGQDADVGQREAQDEYLRRGQRVGDQHLGRYERRAPHGDGEQRREVVSVFRIFCHAAPKLLIFWLLTLISTRRIRVI